MPKIEITEFRGDYYFLSNFYAHSISYEGVTYPTSEHAFQAAKLPPEFADKRTVVAFMATPGQAKAYGRSCHLREDWEEAKIGIMEDILRIKFTDTVLSAKLRDTSPATLIEGNHWGDKFWGVCLKTGVGLNHLGQLLMKIRDTKSTRHKRGMVLMKFGNKRATIRETQLYDYDPDCEHVNDPNCWSGIRCKKCQGWYCL